MAPPDLWPWEPPCRVRKSIPTAWLELGIREGPNRQVRRMPTTLGLPTLRLVRVTIGDFRLRDLMPGELRLLDLHPSTRPPQQPLC